MAVWGLVTCLPCIVCCYATFLGMALLFPKAVVWAICEFSWFVDNQEVGALFNSLLLLSDWIVCWFDETFFGSSLLVHLWLTLFNIELLGDAPYR